MKTKDKLKEKTPVRPTGEFDAVKFMREQRDRISREIKHLSPKEIIRYFEKTGTENRVKPSA